MDETGGDGHEGVQAETHTASPVRVCSRLVWLQTCRAAMPRSVKKDSSGHDDVADADFHSPAEVRHQG